MGIISIGCTVGCGYGNFKRPVLCSPLVLVLDLQPDEFGCLVQPSGVTFLLLNLDRQKKLHGSWRWIAQRLELAGTDQNGNMFRFKAKPEGGFGWRSSVRAVRPNSEFLCVRDSYVFLGKSDGDGGNMGVQQAGETAGSGLHKF